MIGVFPVCILVVCAKFGGDMCASLPAHEDLIFQVLERWTGYGSGEIGTLPQSGNRFVFAFLAQFALESCTDGALHRGDTSLVHSRPAFLGLAGKKHSHPRMFFAKDTHLRTSCNPLTPILKMADS